MKIISVLAFVFLAPFVGGLLAGIDRKLTAYMQGRVGPSILQPFYDVLKLLQKKTVVVNRSQSLFVFFYLLFIIFTGVLFFMGGDLLLFVFSLTLAGIFFVLAGYNGSSPYSYIGAERELLQMMAYEPMVLFAIVAIFQVCDSFFVSDVISYSGLLIKYLPGIFVGLVFVYTIKFRKSPFDLSTSHHAHQELVKGITTELSGRLLAYTEIAHWYETIFLLGLIYLFFASIPWLGVLVALLVFFLEILIDNTFARVKWQKTLFSAWWVAIIFGVTNIVVLYYFIR